MSEILLIVATAAATILFSVLMLRGLVGMYRNKDRTGTFSSGVAGAMMEIDRVVRPSVQHLAEAKEHADSQEDRIGGK